MNAPLPGPPVARWPWQIAGVARAMSDSPIETVAACFEEFGDVHRVRVAGRTVVRVRRPEHVHRILVTDAKAFGKPTKGPGIDPVKLLVRNGILLAEGDTWRRHRRMIQPSLLRSRIGRYARTMIDVARRQLTAIPQQTPVDLNRRMSMLTLEAVCELLFDAGPSEEERIHDLLERQRQEMGPAAFIPGWMPLPPVLRYRRTIGDLERVVYRIIDERLKEPREALQDRDDLLSALACSVDDESEGARSFDREQLRDELLTLFIAGHDTTSQALTWTLFALCRDPELLARVQAEVDAVADDYDLIDAALPLTDAVLAESMRLYPPVFAIPRKANEDLEIEGHRVPRNTMVAAWTIFTHRDERWWPDPLKFLPERFLPGTELGDREIVPGSYVPFGEGTRTCIGKHFALLEARLILAVILRSCTLDLVSTEHPGFRAGTGTLLPRDGLWARVSPRTDAVGAPAQATTAL